jgi:hypothetical protein
MNWISIAGAMAFGAATAIVGFRVWDWQFWALMITAAVWASAHAYRARKS